MALKAKGKGLKILTPKKMLQGLPIAVAQATACNASEIHQINFSLDRKKEITKKVYNNIMSLIKVKINIIFITSENRKTFDAHRQLLIFQIK